MSVETSSLSRQSHFKLVIALLWTPLVHLDATEFPSAGKRLIPTSF